MRGTLGLLLAENAHKRGAVVILQHGGVKPRDFVLMMCWASFIMSAEASSPECR